MQFLNMIHGKKPEESPYAGFHIRLFANIIDLAFLFIFSMPIFDVINGVLYGGIDPESILLTFSAMLEHGEPPEEAAAYLAGSGLIQSMILINIVQTALIGVFYVWCWVVFQATPGKWLLGLEVLDARTLEPATRGQYIRRYMGLYLSVPPFMLGYIWMGFNKKKQTWHDLMAGTVVIYGERSLRERWKRFKAWIKKESNGES